MSFSPDPMQIRQKLSGGEFFPELQLHVLRGHFRGLQEESSGFNDMDQVLWNRLPEDILEHVLFRLPPASRLRFRSVCSSWRTLLSSSAFLHQSAAALSRSPPTDLICAFEYDCPYRLPPPPRSTGTRRRLTIATAGSGPASASASFSDNNSEDEGNSESHHRDEEETRLLCELFCRHSQDRVWNLDLSFVPANLLSRNVKSQGNGLLLCLSQGIPGARFVINPMARTWRELPPLPLAFRERVWAEEVRCCPSSSGFTVVVIKGTGSDAWCVCVYSSLSHAWKTSPGQPYHGHRYFQYWPRFFIDNLIYSHDRLLGDLLIHSLEDGRLVKTVPVGFPPIPHMQERACYELPVRYLRVIFMEYRGAVYGGFLFRSGLHHFGGISELDRNRMVWGESLLLPDSLNDEARDAALTGTGTRSGFKAGVAEWTPFCCGTISLVGDCICFNLHSEKVHAAASLQHVVAFHIPTRSWRTLFPRAFVGVAKQYWLFEPRSLNVLL